MCDVKDENKKRSVDYNEQSRNFDDRKSDSHPSNDAQFTVFTDRTNLIRSFVKISKELPIGSTMENNNDDTVGCKENVESPVAKYDEKSFRGKNLFSDNVKPSAVQFQCEMCVKKFNSMSNLNYHVQRFHRQKKMFCCYDDEKFSSERSWDRYIKEHLEINPSFVIKKEIMEQQIVECNECDKKFATKSSLLNHKRMAHRVTAAGLENYCKLCRIYYSFNNLARHEKTMKHKQAEAQMKNLSENLERNERGEKFSVESNLLLHKKVAHRVTRDLAFYCNVCDKNLSNKHNFARHKQSLQHKEAMAQVKSLSKNLKCNECDEKFARKSNLILHKKVAHRVTRDLANYCNICDMNQANLRQHKKTIKHKKAEAQLMKSIEKQKENRLDKKNTEQIIGENFVCGTCDGKFYDFDLLVRHVQAVHLYDRQKCYRCNDCGMDFDEKLRLEVHWLAVHIKQENVVLSECF